MLTKKRKPITAAMLSIIVPGLGQIYNGQIIKGIVFFCVGFFLTPLLELAGLQFSFYGLICLITFPILFGLFIAGEAFFTARRLKEISVGPFDKWYYYLLIIVVSLGFYFLTHDYFKSNILAVKAYKISSRSMIPSLRIGDRIMVNLKYYEKNSLSKGDVVIYQRPQNQSNFVGRIIATENDIIESRGKIIYVNGNALNEPFIQHEDKEIINNKRDNFLPVNVQKGSVFIMGDNRDDSYDSRFFGTVSLNQIKGKVAYVFWSNPESSLSR